MVKLALLRSQTGFDIPQAFPVGELSKRHAEVVVETSEVLDLEVAAVSLDALMEDMERKMLHYLRENELPGIHGNTSRTLLHESAGVSGKISSR